jgi:hypothetical protein
MTHIPTGLKVTSLQSTIANADDPFTALSTCLEWIKQFGIAPGSISGMAWKLLRASLTNSVSLGFDPAISEQAFFGGRQEIWSPDVYKGYKSLDIKAAYPTAMSSHPIALSLRSVASSTDLDPNVAGLAAASVYVPPNLPYAPLPVRVDKDAIQFQHHELVGIWSWRELNAARVLGCEVDVSACWAPRQSFDLFGPWWDLAQEGRGLANGADQMAKAIANSTWGQFSMRGDDRAEIYWSDDKGRDPFMLDLPARKLPHVYGLHVAAEICARVRVQTLIEGLYGSSGLVVHVDTDGLIIPEEATIAGNLGDNFGEWRTKEIMETLDVRAPQLYRFTRPDEPDRWNYVASGQNHDQAVYTFSKHPDLRTSISVFSRLDRCLAPGSSRDTGAIAAQLDQMRKIAS